MVMRIINTAITDPIVFAALNYLKHNKGSKFLSWMNQKIMEPMVVIVAVKLLAKAMNKLFLLREKLRL